MSRSRVAAVLTGASIVASIAASLRWGGAASSAPAPRVILLAHRAERPRMDDNTLAAAEDATVSNDPFRLANEPASVRYDPTSDGVVNPAPVAPVVRPTLVLKAIVGGPPWQAVIDGIPGQPPGTVASSGARFDKLLVRSVSRDTVVVQGPDTTWFLAFKGRM